MLLKIEPLSVLEWLEHLLPIVVFSSLELATEDRESEWTTYTPPSVELESERRNREVGKKVGGRKGRKRESIII